MMIKVTIELVEEIKDKELEDILKRGDKFKYQLLGRMQCDCEYYLGNGGKNPKDLWAKDEQKHIDYMKAIYGSFENKPQWIDMSKIREYEMNMCFRAAVKVCPKCGRKYKERPAISRRDNKTKICPECGMLEALEDLEKELFL